MPDYDLNAGRVAAVCDAFDAMTSPSASALTLGPEPTALRGPGPLVGRPNRRRFARPVYADEAAEQPAPLPAVLLHGALGQRPGAGEADAVVRVERGERPLVEVTAQVPVHVCWVKVHRALAFRGS
jgi:hypothetical protein